ncbi:hypothetical protein DM02DRAFT_607837 [Periconia macrospinosa]|uniref:Uncharacterized protein n=1 Tax=Periconia macrospinosa TaxID=97972 RepID=A0A2V1EG07_9PLEO|nr:hypothetical protein DM02DRAFT_607837 [Periconia macrospinosa]
MQFKFVAVAALAGAVVAQDVPEQVKHSVLDVLAKALPTSAIAAAISNQPAFISQVASAYSAGQTPGWYGSLPDDVKTLLTKMYPVATPTASSSSAPASSSVYSVVTPTPAPTTSAAPTTTSSASYVASTGASISGGPGSNSTTVTSINSPTLSAPSSPSAPPASQSQGAAAGLPVAAMGSSIVGALGVVGMLLL